MLKFLQTIGSIAFGVIIANGAIAIADEQVGSFNVEYVLLVLFLTVTPTVLLLVASARWSGSIKKFLARIVGRHESTDA